MATKTGKLSKVFEYFCDEDPFAAGLSCCAGCPLELALRFIGKVLGRKDLVITGTPSCSNPVIMGQNVGAWHMLPSYGTLMTERSVQRDGAFKILQKERAGSHRHMLQRDGPLRTSVPESVRGGREKRNGSSISATTTKGI